MTHNEHAAHVLRAAANAIHDGATGEDVRVVLTEEADHLRYERTPTAPGIVWERVRAGLLPDPDEALIRRTLEAAVC